MAQRCPAEIEIALWVGVAKLVKLLPEVELGVMIADLLEIPICAVVLGNRGRPALGNSVLGWLVPVSPQYPFLRWRREGQAF